MVVTITSTSTEEEIETALKKLDEGREADNVRVNSGFDAHKYCGTIQLKEDPLETQKKWRDGWE